MLEATALQLAEELIKSNSYIVNPRLKRSSFHPADPNGVSKTSATWGFVFTREPHQAEIVREDGVKALWQEGDFIVIVEVNDETGEATFFQTL